MSYLIFILIIPVILSFLIRIRGHQLTWQFFSKASTSLPNEFPGISILIPVRGVDQNADQNFQSYAQQDYPGSYEVVFALEEDTDPAVPIIEKLIDSNPSCLIKIVYSHESEGIGKIKNQIAASHECQYDLWVLVDSDVELPKTFLKTQAAPLVDKPDVGLAYAAPVGVGSQDWVAALYNISVSNSILHSCKVAMEDNIKAGVGSCMVTRRDVINRIGGLESISNKVVGLDLSLCKEITDKGFKIKLLNEVIRITHNRDKFSRFWWQVHRWITTINQYIPGYWLIAIIVGLPICWSLAFLIASVSIGRFQVIGILLLISTLLCEITSSALINIKIIKDKHLWYFLWVVAIREIVILPILILSSTSKKVKWRGRWLDLNSTP